MHRRLLLDDDGDTAHADAKFDYDAADAITLSFRGVPETCFKKQCFCQTNVSPCCSRNDKVFGPQMMGIILYELPDSTIFH